ncbi:MAG: hydroxyacid dehydrogenase [Puniceicoccaceae bacterium]
MRNESKICVVLDDWEKASFTPPAVLEELGSISQNVTFAEGKQFPDGAGWLDWLKAEKPEILISGWMTPGLPENTLEEVPELKYVCHLVGSIKNTIPEKLIQDGLIVTNWGNSVSRTIAESALMLAIAGLRRVSYWTMEMHTRGGWKERTSVVTGSVFGRKVGLHGFGAISQELRKLLVPFEVPVMTYSPSVPDSILEEKNVQRANSLEELFSSNDVIVELAALTEKNRGIVTEELLRMIPEGGVFVNVGRGAVVDEEALARIAEEGKIQVALDVYGEEPLPLDSPFRKLDQVLTQPHLGGPTVDRRQDASWYGLANIRRYLNGEELQSQITAEVSKRIT